MLYIKEIVIMVLLAFVIVGNLTDVIYDYREDPGVNGRHAFSAWFIEDFL